MARLATIGDPTQPHHTLGGVRFLPPLGCRDGLPQPHWLGHALAGPFYHWSQCRRMPGFGVCHFSLAGQGLLEGRRRAPPESIPVGTAVLYEPGEAACPFRGDSTPGYTWEFLSFFFTGTAAMTIFGDLIANHGRIVPVPMKADWMEELCHLGCNRFGEVRLSPAEGSDLVLRCLSGLLSQAERQGLHTEARNLVVQAENWSAAHLHEDVGVIDVANALGVSREHLARTMMRVRGTTVGMMLDRQRVEVAKSKLRSGSDTLGNIARGIGLELNTFHRVFLRVTGSTPASFRRFGDVP